MNLNETKIKYIKNILKYSKRYVQQTTEPKIIHRNDRLKLSIGQHITIEKNPNSERFYFFYLGNQIFNLTNDKIILSGIEQINYLDLQDKDMYFNNMISGDIGKLCIQDFIDMEYIYNGLRKLLC